MNKTLRTVLIIAGCFLLCALASFGGMIGAHYALKELDKSQQQKLDKLQNDLEAKIAEVQDEVEGVSRKVGDISPSGDLDSNFEEIKKELSGIKSNIGDLELTLNSIKRDVSDIDSRIPY